MLGDRLVEVDKEDSFKFQAFDVPNVEYSYIPVVADNLSVLTGDSRKVDLFQPIVEFQSQRFHLLFLIHQNGNCRGLTP